MRAAVPEYLGTQFDSAPPGHRFGLYFSGWNPEWKNPEKSLKRYNQVVKLGESATRVAEGLWLRQQDLAEREQVLTIDAKSISPFSTGLGNEHPTENGFSFLYPYGLPYLPGSSIKGVLRSTARELLNYSDDAQPNWSDQWIDQLFGKAGDEEGNSGALLFWDVIPKIKGGKMGVEIMNPHYGDYYQNNNNCSPNDAGNPIPIFFLTIPPDSDFTFHVGCRLDRLDCELKKDWQQLLNISFRHAFEWVGFGAKTSVGYGAMVEDEVQAKEREERRIQIEQDNKRRLEIENKRRNMTPAQLQIAEWLDKNVDKVPEHTYLIKQLEKGEIDQKMTRDVAKEVKKMMESNKKWREKSNKKRPEKDKEFQQTKKVKKFLDG